MIDKIRLHNRGELPVADYAANLGKGFDLRCCNFLRVPYDELKAQVLQGHANDEQLLAWAHEHGGARTDEECETWNGYMMKRGWRDPLAETLERRIRESHLEGKPIMSMFDYIDFDEGRDSVAAKSWLG